jgi:hypothetical protein
LSSKGTLSDRSILDCIGRSEQIHLCATPQKKIDLFFCNPMRSTLTLFLPHTYNIELTELTCEAAFPRILGATLGSKSVGPLATANVGCIATALISTALRERRFAFLHLLQ